MKSFIFKKILNGLMCLVTLFGLFCFMSCAADAGSDSGSGNTDKLVLDFNGGKMFNYKFAEFSIEEITPYVGMPIDKALAALGIDTTNIKKEGLYLHGWTLKKDAETCVQNLPTFGTLYAKWGTEPLEDDNENVPLTLTLDFQGGKVDGATTKYFDNSKVASYAGKNIDEVLSGLGVTNPTKEDYVFIGWTDNLTTANKVTTLPTSGDVILYAMWRYNGTSNPLTLTLDFNGGMSGTDIRLVLNDDVIAAYKGMPIANYFAGSSKPLPTKEGYTLLGWSTTQDGEATITNIPLEGTITYYAVWQEEQVINPEIIVVVFDLDGGKHDGNININLDFDYQKMQEYKGKPISEFLESCGIKESLMYKEGYIFKGWTLTQNGEDYVTHMPLSTTLSGAVKYWAKWEEFIPKKITFTIDAGKGTFVNEDTEEILNTITVEFDSGKTLNEIKMPAFVPNVDTKGDIQYSYEDNGTYYYITGIKNAEGKVVLDYINYVIDQTAYTTKFYEDTTWYVTYAKIVNITFKLNGGYVEQYDHETDEENIVTTDIFGFGLEGYKAFSVNDPERDGYVFMGWTLTKDGNDFVTVVPSEDTTLYAKWELPKECVLTINAGEYSQLFDRDGNSLGREVNLTFTSGMTLEGVLSNNNIDFDFMVNEFEIPDTTFEGLKDSEGNEYSYNIANHISDKKLVDSITLYPFYQRIEISGNVGILKYYDYVNDYGNYDEKAEPKYEKKYDKDIFEECLNTPHADGYIFAGWTYTPNGNDYVNLNDYIPAGVTTTVYAKWIPESEVKPLYEYSSDNSQITFTFVPSYFGYDWDSDEFHEVQLMSEAVGWDPKEKRLMEKDSDGNYTVTTDYNGVANQGYTYYAGFKFYVYEDDAWLGPNQYKLPLSPDEIINDADPCFKLELASSRLSLDLNGGNIDGKGLYSDFEVDEYINQRYPINYFIVNQNLSLPVKEGYIFAGWTLTEDGDDYVDYVPGGINTIYAKWVVPSTQTITLIARDGDEFYNWNDEPLGNEVSFEFEVGITLNELLSQNNMSYHSMLRDYESNSEIISFTNFVDVSGNIYTDSKILASDIVLTAQYRVCAKITFDLNGGQFKEGEENQTILVNDNELYYLDWYEKPTKEGYKFIGWTSTKDGDDFINDITGPIPNGIVYAKWQDPLKLFDKGDLIGDFAVVKGASGWKFDESAALALTYEGNGVYSAMFTYHDYMCGWDQDTDYCDFKIRAVAGSWQGASYGVLNYLDQPELDGDEVLCGSDNAPNVRIPAEEGVTYKVTFRCASDGNVYVKIATVQ